MAEIVNLNKFRKRRDRQEAIKEAAENRVRSGRSKAETTARRRTADKAKKDLDDKKID